MRKKLKKYGGTMVFVMTKDDIENYELKEGHIYDMEIADLTGLDESRQDDIEEDIDRIYEDGKIDNYNAQLLEKSEEDLKTTSNTKEETSS